MPGLNSVDLQVPADRVNVAGGVRLPCIRNYGRNTNSVMVRVTALAVGRMRLGLMRLEKLPLHMQAYAPTTTAPHP